MTIYAQRPMSALGPKRTSLVAPHMSAFGSKADMAFLRCECLLLTQADMLSALRFQGKAFSNERTASMISALRYGLAINMLFAGISSRWGALMPVVTMMWTGGQ